MKFVNRSFSKFERESKFERRVFHAGDYQFTAPSVSIIERRLAWADRMPDNLVFLSVQGLEATLSDSKKKYIDKVNTLLAAWEHVTNYIANSPETTQSLVEWANE